MAAKVKTIDGGFSTQLSRYVGPIDGGNSLWTAKYVLTDPDAVFKTHLDYLNAGAEFIETSTYQASIAGYKKYFNISEDEAIKLIEKSGQLAMNAKNAYLKEHPDANVEVVGSIGPFGALLHDGSEYTGSYTSDITSEIIQNVQIPRIKGLMKTGINTFAFETIPSKKEAEMILDLLHQFPSIKAWLSFSCKDGELLSFGDNFQETAVKCYKTNPNQIIAIGVNCTSPLYTHSLFKGINNLQSMENFIPLIVYPNSGEKYSVETGWSEHDAIQPLYTYVKDWIELGVRYIGGCCRTDSNDIALIKKEIDRLKMQQ